MQLADARAYSLNVSSHTAVVVRQFQPAPGDDCSLATLNDLFGQAQNEANPWSCYVLFVPRRFLREASMTFDNFKHEEPGASAVAALLYLLLAQIAERGDLAAEGARGPTACVRLFCQTWYAPGGKGNGTVDGFMFFYYERTPDQDVRDRYKHIHTGIMPFVRDLIRDYNTVISRFYLPRLAPNDANGAGGGGGPRGRITDLSPERYHAWRYLINGFRSVSAYQTTVKHYAMHVPISDSSGIIDVARHDMPYALSNILTLVNAVSLQRTKSSRPPCSPSNRVLTPGEQRHLFLYRPPVANEAKADMHESRASPISASGFVHSWYLTDEAHRIRDIDESPQRTWPPEPAERRPLPCDELATVTLTRGHVHPLETTWACTAMPHLNSRVVFESPEFTAFRQEWIQRHVETDDSIIPEEFVPTIAQEAQIRDDYRDFASSKRDNIQFATYLDWCAHHKERTHLADPASRALVFPECWRIYTPDNAIGATQRAIARWFTDRLNQRLEPHGFARFFSMSRKDTTSGVISRYLAYSMNVAYHGRHFVNTALPFLVINVMADAASLITARTNPRLVLMGPKSTGKSHTADTYAAERIPGSVLAYSYRTAKARLGTHHNGGYEELTDDAGPQDFGLPKMQSQTPYSMFQYAAGLKQPEQDELSGFVKASCTNQKIRTQTASVEQGNRDSKDAESIRYGTSVILSNLPMALVDPAQRDRQIEMPIYPSAKRSAMDTVSHQLASKRHPNDPGSNAMLHNARDRTRRDQFFHSVCNLLSAAGAIAPVNLSWASPMLDVILRNFQNHVGYLSRRNRAVDLVLQVVQVMTQKQAFTAYDMGLLRPDASEAFSFAHLQGLSYFMVAGFDALLPALEMTGVFLDPGLLATARLLYEFDRRYRSEGKRLIHRPDHFEYPEAFHDLNERQTPDEFHRFMSLRRQLLSFPQDPTWGYRMEPNALNGYLGQLSTQCMVMPGAPDSAPYQHGLILGQNHGSLLIHRNVIRLGQPGFDPFGDVLRASVPSDWPSGKVYLRGKLDAGMDRLQEFHAQQDVEGHPAVRLQLDMVLSAHHINEATSLAELLESNLPGPEFERLRNTVENVRRVLVHNGRFVPRKVFEATDHSDPSASFSLRVSGVLAQKPVEEISYRGYKQAVVDHLASLGMQTDDIKRFCAVPQHFERCQRRYARFCDAMSKLRDVMMETVQSVHDHVLEEPHLKDLRVRVKDAVSEATWEFCAMWSIFFYHGSCMFWKVAEPDSVHGTVIHLHGIAEQDVHSEAEDPPNTLGPVAIQRGYRMSLDHVWFYMRPYFHAVGIATDDSYARTMFGDLPERWQRLVWICMQMHHKEGDIPNLPYVQHEVLVAEASAFTQRWFVKQLREIGPPIWSAQDQVLQDQVEPFLDVNSVNKRRRVEGEEDEQTALYERDPQYLAHQDDNARAEELVQRARQVDASNLADYQMSLLASLEAGQVQAGAFDDDDIKFGDNGANTRGEEGAAESVDPEEEGAAPEEDVSSNQDMGPIGDMRRDTSDNATVAASPDVRSGDGDELMPDV